MADNDPRERSREMLDRIAEVLGVDASVFTTLATASPEGPSDPDRLQARLLAAFARIEDVRMRTVLVEIVETQAELAGAAR